MTLSQEWTIKNTGTNSAASNMQYDADLLDKLMHLNGPLLHLYDWQNNSATYGLLVDPFDFLSTAGVEKMGLDLARRPTGGGIIFHIWDLAFSVAVPSHSKYFSENTLENYEFVNKAVLSAAKEFLKCTDQIELIKEDFQPKDVSCKRFCMAQPTKYDVVLGGKKIAGAAQRKTKNGFLHQGTISLMMPSRDYLEQVLLPDTEVLDAMFINSYPLLGQQASTEDLKEARLMIQKLLINHLTRDI